MTVSKFFTLLLAVATASLASCASSSKDEIAKVNIYKLKGKDGVISADPAISFEQKYYLYGAVSKADIAERVGNYYNVHWSVADKTQPVKLVLTYRQSTTGATTFTKEVTPDVIKGKNNTQLQIVGEEFTTKGHVTSWKIALVRGKEELAVHKSYLWE